VKTKSRRRPAAVRSKRGLWTECSLYAAGIIHMKEKQLLICSVIFLFRKNIVF
jgi:hypothetical protein